MKRFIVFCLASFCVISVFSQEFRVSVSVNSTQLQSSDREVFQQIQELLTEFVNERKWTDVTYEEYEKIEGSISITITEHSTQEDFKGDINLQLRRPVYGSTYTTTLLNTQEQGFTFKFTQGQSLEFEQNNLPRHGIDCMCATNSESPRVLSPSITINPRRLCISEPAVVANFTPSRSDKIALISLFDMGYPD